LKFLSWIEFDGRAYFLTLNDLNTVEGRDLRRNLGDRFFDDIGQHGSIMAFYRLPVHCRHRVESDFSSPDRFPSEIVAAMARGGFAGLGMPTLPECDKMVLPGVSRTWDDTRLKVEHHETALHTAREWCHAVQGELGEDDFIGERLPELKVCRELLPPGLSRVWDKVFVRLDREARAVDRLRRATLDLPIASNNRYLAQREFQKMYLLHRKNLENSAVIFWKEFRAQAAAGRAGSPVFQNFERHRDALNGLLNEASTVFWETFRDPRNRAPAWR